MSNCFVFKSNLKRLFQINNQWVCSDCSLTCVNCFQQTLQLINGESVCISCGTVNKKLNQLVPQTITNNITYKQKDQLSESTTNTNTNNSYYRNQLIMAIQEKFNSNRELKLLSVDIISKIDKACESIVDKYLSKTKTPYRSIDILSNTILILSIESIPSLAGAFDIDYLIVSKEQKIIDRIYSLKQKLENEIIETIPVEEITKIHNRFTRVASLLELSYPIRVIITSILDDCIDHVFLSGKSADYIIGASFLHALNPIVEQRCQRMGNKHIKFKFDIIDTLCEELKIKRKNLETHVKELSIRCCCSSSE